MVTKAAPLPLLFACSLICWAQRASAETDQGHASPDESAALAELAVRQNPGVTAIKARISALEQRIPRAKAWPDPMVGIEYSSIPIDSWALGDHAMSGLQLKLEQTFPFPGKLSLREEVAQGEVREHRLLLEERKVQLRAAVQRAYFNLALVRHLKAVTQDHLKLVDPFIDVVRIKYEVGKVGQQDLLRLQVLQGKLQDDLYGFDRDDRALTSTINATLHRRVDHPIQTPERLSEPPLTRTIDQLVAEAKKSRPLLRWTHEQARTRRAMARQAGREGYPDLTAWISYRVRVGAGLDPGTDFFSAGLSIPLPFSRQRRWGSQQQENKAQASAAEAQGEEELDNIRGSLDRHLAAWQRARQQAKTYRDKLMPQAHHTLDATFSAYQVDRVDFASLFQAEIQLLDFERTIRQAEAQASLSRVEVEALVGKSL